MPYTIMVRTNENKWRTLTDDKKKPIVVEGQKGAMDYLLSPINQHSRDYRDAASNGWRTREVRS